MANSSRLQDEEVESESAAPSASGVRLGDTRTLLSGARRLSVGLVSLVKEEGAEGLGELLATIHERIIPQLLLAHYDADNPVVVSERIPTASEVAAFAELSTRGDAAMAVSFVEAVASQGVSLESIMLDLIAPAARLLGDGWLDDTRTFTDVTLGLGILQQVVHTFGPSLAPTGANRGSVVLVAAPSEQHTLGVHVLGEFLRRAGWGVQVETGLTLPELVDIVETQSIELVGISISNSDLVSTLSSLVVSLRKSPLNPNMAVMMGGTAVLSAAEHLAIGATFCNDPRECVRWLDEHMRVLRDGSTPASN